LPKVKGLANKIYEFFQKKKSLVKKRYKFCQKLEVKPKIDIGFAKREKFSQERI
jgi:hypothetical protein